MGKRETHAEALEVAYQAALASPLALGALCTIDGPAGPEPLHLWDCQVRVIQTAINQKRTIVLKPRQVGISWGSGLLALWWAMAHPGTTTLILSIGEREAVELLRRVRRLWDSLPAGIKSRWDVEPAQHRFALGTSHGTSAIISLPSSSSAGRGYTVSLLILDEAAFMPSAAERMGALLPTIGDIGRVVMLSTANGVSGYFADVWQQSVANENDWEDVFIRADERPDRGMEWIARERAALGVLGPQEYPMNPEEAFLNSGANVFPPELLHQINEEQCSPAPWVGRLDRDAAGVHAIRDDDGEWNLWTPPQPGRKYLIAADVCAGAGARDSAHVVIYDIESWDQIGFLHGKPSPGQLGQELIKAGWLYKSGDRPALIAPEANSYGQATIATLTNDGYPNLYHHNRMDREDPSETALVGFYTSQKSRALALGALQTGLRERTLGVRDPGFIKEGLAFIIDDNGKMTAGPGAHDDRVICHAIASLVLQWSGVADSLRGNATVLHTLPRASFYLNGADHRGTRNQTGTVSYR